MARETSAALRTFHGSDGRHEGIVYFIGRRADQDTVVAGAIVPDCEHGRGFVEVDHAAVGAMARTARRLGVAVVTQVHSHPGRDTRHSDGDDRLVLLPHDGMFSVVIAKYGDGSLEDRRGVGLHQFQAGRWVKIEPIDDALIIVPQLISS